MHLHFLLLLYRALTHVRLHMICNTTQRNEQVSVSSASNHARLKQNTTSVKILIAHSRNHDSSDAMRVKVFKSYLKVRVRVTGTRLVSPSSMQMGGGARARMLFESNIVE